MNKRRLLPFLNATLLAAAILLLCTLTLTYKPIYPTQTLDEGWDVTINGVHSENVTLSKFYEILDGNMSLGDHIVMAKVLPDIGYLPNPALIFRTRYTTLNCYLDGKLLYSFGDDLYQKNNFLGKLYQIITLDTDYIGKILVFDMYVAEDSPFIKLDPPLLGTHQDVAGELIHSHLIVIGTGVFLYISGICFLCMALLFVTTVPEVKSLLFGAVFSINLGIWLLSYYNMLSMFIYTPYETQVEYLTLYLIVPYCYLLLYYILDLKGDRVFMAIMAAGCGIPLLQFILHFAFNIHLRVSLPLYHIDGLFGFGLIIFYLVRNSRKKKLEASAQVQIAGILCFAIALLIHFFIYYIESFHISFNSFFSMLVISAGCLLFVMCQISTYMIFITDNYARKQENISLSHLAYADGLTNLANRAKAEKYLNDLDESDDDYCIISIDLNGLKPINDKFGHPTGDKYIMDFSKVLANTFDEQALCARVGGDEFLVIMPNSTNIDIGGLINRMNSALNVLNALYTEYHRSVATGFAFRHEFKTPTAHKVYMRADQRMYEEKRKMHEELGIHSRL